MAHKPTKSGLPADWGKISIRIPHETLANIKALVNAERSVSSICRDLVDSVFGDGLPAPAELGSLTEPIPHAWAHVSIYVKNATRARASLEVKRRATGEDKRVGSAAKAVAWLVEQRYGTGAVQP